MLSPHFTSRRSNKHGMFHACYWQISPPGDLTKLDNMIEWDALESNKIVAGCELARNMPSTTSWACWASSLVTWLTLPYMKFCGPCGFAWFTAPGTACLAGHWLAKWPVEQHLKQAPSLWLLWASAFCEVGMLGQGPCYMFWWGFCYTLGWGACCQGYIWKFGRNAW
jgi:hypothetical protein